MKSNLFSFLHNPKNQTFTNVAWLTFIVYFIISFCGYFNFLVANFSAKNYFPLRSYLIAFDNIQIKNMSQISKSIYNLAGYKAIINTTIPYKIIDDVFLTLVSTALIILFFIGYKIVESKKINQLEIVKWSIVFSTLMVFSFPSHSSDLYGYIARGAQQTLYNQNPYLGTVDEIPGYKSNPMFLNFMWTSQPTTYGPVFIYLTKAIVLLSNNNFFLSFINFKLFNLTLFFFLVLFALRLNQAKDLYLIAWNPLIMTQGLWNCHNDLFSGVLIFFGLYLLIKENYFWSIFCLTISAGVKFVSLLIIPIIFFYFLKHKPDKKIFLNFVLGLCSGFILIIIFSIDFLSPLANVHLHSLSASFNKIFSNINLVHKSFISTIFTTVKYFCRWQHINCNLLIVQDYFKYFFYTLFGMFYLWVLLKRKSSLISDIVLVLFIFLAFTIAKFHSWYLLNVIILIPLLKDGVTKKLLVLLSITHTYAITFLDQAKILNFVSMTLLPVLFVLFKRKNNKALNINKFS